MFYFSNEQQMAHRIDGIHRFLYVDSQKQTYYVYLVKNNNELGFEQIVSKYNFTEETKIIRDGVRFASNKKVKRIKDQYIQNKTKDVYNRDTIFELTKSNLCFFCLKKKSNDNFYCFMFPCILSEEDHYTAFAYASRMENGNVAYDQKNPITNLSKRVKSEKREVKFEFELLVLTSLQNFDCVIVDSVASFLTIVNKWNLRKIVKYLENASKAIKELKDTKLNGESGPVFNELYNKTCEHLKEIEAKLGNENSTTEHVTYNEIINLTNKYTNFLRNVYSICQIFSINNKNEINDFRIYDRTNVIFYRGVTAPQYSEMPKIMRTTSINVSMYKDEATICKEFTLLFPKHFKDMNMLETLTEMQHYFCPTRLLDITSNPLVALYMACNDEYSNKLDTVLPGEVIAYLPEFDFNDKECQYKYYDSDVISVNAFLPMLENDERLAILYYYQFNKKNRRTKFLDNAINKEEDEITKSDKTMPYFSEAHIAYNKIKRLINRERNNFDFSLFEPHKLLKSYYVRVGLVNERIAAQSGSFIIFGLQKDYVEKTFINSRKKGYERIIVENKNGILLELANLNISQKTLTPDMEHAAKFIDQQMKNKMLNYSDYDIVDLFK